jgi:hypothetical protein
MGETYEVPGSEQIIEVWHRYVQDLQFTPGFIHPWAELSPRSFLPAALLDCIVHVEVHSFGHPFYHLKGGPEFGREVFFNERLMHFRVPEPVLERLCMFLGGL